MGQHTSRIKHQERAALFQSRAAKIRADQQKSQKVLNHKLFNGSSTTAKMNRHNLGISMESRLADDPKLQDNCCQNWMTAATTLTEEAEKIVGRGRPPCSIGAPYTDEDAVHIEYLKQKLQEAKQKIFAVARTHLEAEAQEERKLAKRRLDHFKKRARARYVKSVCAQLTTAAQNGDMGLFYQTLPKLGVYVYGKSKQGEEPHTLVEIKEFLENLGSNPKNVDDDLITEHTPKIDEQKWMEEEPTDSEIEDELKLMKPSAPGHDEITATMLKNAGPRFLGIVRDTVRRLWRTRPRTWEAELHK